MVRTLRCGSILPGNVSLTLIDRLEAGTTLMMIQRHFKRMRIEVRNELHLLHVGDIDIWDGADLALLREGLFKLIEQEGCRSIAINMSCVKYIPSGFFGMLYDWQEKRGVQFALTPPQPNVQRMLWFQRFFHLNTATGLYELQTETVSPMAPANVDTADLLVTATL